MKKATIKDEPPKNYKPLKLATTAPIDCLWFWNGKPLFNDGGFDVILVRSKDEQNSTI